jgi:hypothetical protein
MILQPMRVLRMFFTRSGATWTQRSYLKASNTDEYDYFGVSIAVSGTTAIVGAWWEDGAAVGINGDGDDDSIPYAGAAYIFNLDYAPVLTIGYPRFPDCFPFGSDNHIEWQGVYGGDEPTFRPT